MESLACVINNKMDLRIEKVLLGALGETQVSVRVLAGGISTTISMAGLEL
jgi:hypothetical protein